MGQPHLNKQQFHYFEFYDIRKNNLDELTTELLDTISRKETYKFDVTSIQQRYIDAFKSLANEF